MLLTGFDAPVEQVIYLDKVVVAHGLLQAIARVNRVSGPAKDKGFVIDYVGVGHHLKKALDNYDEHEQAWAEGSYRSRRIFDLFYDEDVRFEYVSLFGDFTKALNVVFPSREALPFMKEYQRLSEIKVLAEKHFRDARLSMKGVPEKLWNITDAYLESRGVSTKIKPISILDEDFQKEVKGRTRTKTKAAEIEHAIRHHLECRAG